MPPQTTYTNFQSCDVTIVPDGARTICTTACVADIGAAMTEAVEQPVDSVLDILPAPVREVAATVTAASPSSFAWVPAMCRRFALA